jgi:hypothetical protein
VLCDDCGRALTKVDYTPDELPERELPARWAWWRCACGVLVKFCWSLGRWVRWR